MKPTRTSFAAIAASALLAASGAQAAPLGPTRASDAHWDARQPAALTTLPTAGASPFQSLLDAAEAGDAEAMNLIGILYILGVQVSTDHSKAVDWFQKAIDGGSASAMHNLAQMYLYGIGVPRDYTNAFRWFQRSAAYGNVHSMYSAAVMAENGLGTPRDLRVSRALYHDAAESGFAPAMVRVSDELARGAAKRDLVEAYAWLQIASQSDLPQELQIVVLSKMEDLGSRLGPDRRNDARARATHLLATIKERVRPTAPAFRSPSPSSPEASGRTLLIRVSEVQP
ncbi:MAG: tetratricopeptide repeat protein [Burkholderiaceae bacterium]